MSSKLSVCVLYIIYLSLVYYLPLLIKSVALIITFIFFFMYKYYFALVLLEIMSFIQEFIVLKVDSLVNVNKKDSSFGKKTLILFCKVVSILSYIVVFYLYLFSVYDFTLYLNTTSVFINKSNSFYLITRLITGFNLFSDEISAFNVFLFSTKFIIFITYFLITNLVMFINIESYLLPLTLILFLLYGKVILLNDGKIVLALLCTIIVTNSLILAFISVYC
jgi:hypothetical protein